MRLSQGPPPHDYDNTGWAAVHAEPMRCRSVQPSRLLFFLRLALQHPVSDAGLGEDVGGAAVVVAQLAAEPLHHLLEIYLRTAVHNNWRRTAIIVQEVKPSEYAAPSETTALVTVEWRLVRITQGFEVRRRTRYWTGECLPGNSAALRFGQSSRDADPKSLRWS